VYGVELPDTLGIRGGFWDWQKMNPTNSRSDSRSRKAVTAVPGAFIVTVCVDVPVNEPFTPAE